VCEQVDVQCELPLFVRGGQAGAVADPGVGEEEIDRAVVILRCGDHLADRLLAGGVPRDSDRVETLSGSGQPVLVEVGDDHPRAGLEERFREGGTDATGSAGDHGHLVVYLHRDAHQSHGPPAT